MVRCSIRGAPGPKVRLSSEAASRKRRRRETMVEQFETMQKFSRMSVERVLTTQATASKAFAAIATETAAYAKKSFAEGKATLEQLSTVKAWDKALEIQTGYFEERPRGLRRADPQGRRVLCRFREGCVQAVRRVNRLYGTEPRSPAPGRAFFVVRVPTPSQVGVAECCRVAQGKTAVPATASMHIMSPMRRRPAPSVRCARWKPRVFRGRSRHPREPAD